MKSATLWADGGWIHIRSPFVREYVDALKLEIDRSFRKWNPTDKTWSVDVTQLDLLIEISERFFKVNVIAQDVQETGGGDSYSELLSSLSDDTLKKIYKLIVLECHPDRSGDGKLLSTVNVAWAKIRKARGMS